MMSDRPPVDHDRTHEHLRVARLAVAAVVVGADLRWSLALEISRGQIVKHISTCNETGRVAAEKARARFAPCARSTGRACDATAAIAALPRARAVSGWPCVPFPPAMPRCSAGRGNRRQIVLQPLRQRMLAAWRRQPIGDQHQCPIAQSHCRAAIRPRKPVEHRIQAKRAPIVALPASAPSPTCVRTDIIARDVTIGNHTAVQQTTRLAEIKMCCQQIPSAEIDDGAAAVLPSASR